MANIPAKVATRLKNEVPKFQKILKSASDRDVNEADTVVIITDMLDAVFGMDKYSEVTREFAIKGTYVDLAVKIEGKIEYLYRGQGHRSGPTGEPPPAGRRIRRERGRQVGGAHQWHQLGSASRHRVRASLK